MDLFILDLEDGAALHEFRAKSTLVAIDEAISSNPLHQVIGRNMLQLLLDLSLERITGVDLLADDVYFKLLQQSTEYFQRIAVVEYLLKIPRVHRDLIAHSPLYEHELLFVLRSTVLFLRLFVRIELLLSPRTFR